MLRGVPTCPPRMAENEVGRPASSGPFPERSIPEVLCSAVQARSPPASSNRGTRKEVKIHSLCSEEFGRREGKIRQPLPEAKKVTAKTPDLNRHSAARADYIYLLLGKEGLQFHQISCIDRPGSRLWCLLGSIKLPATLTFPRASSEGL